jgi:predicted PurR-regulated permease PerM
MERRKLKRVTGLLLVIIAVFGILLAVFALIQTWRLRASFTERVTQALDLTQSTLGNTRQGLEIVHDSLENTATGLDTLQQTTVAIGQTISDTVNLLEDTSTVIGQDVPQTIYSVQDSLAAAQQAAKVVDNVLRVLARIPFASGLAYNPDPPLDQTIADISTNLDDFPASLIKVGDQLKTSSENVSGMQANLDDLSAQLGDIQDNLTAMQVVVEDYQSLLDQASELTQNLYTDLPAWISSAAWIITVILIWFGFAQLGPLLQGWQIYHNNRPPEEQEKPQIEPD